MTAVLLIHVFLFCALMVFVTIDIKNKWTRFVIRALFLLSLFVINTVHEDRGYERAIANMVKKGVLEHAVNPKTGESYYVVTASRECVDVD